MKIKQAAFALIFCLLAFAGNTIAQVAPYTMQLRPSGFTGPDSVTNYVVINVPKVSKADLYNRALTYINGLYGNPQGVVTTVPGASITVNANTNAINYPKQKAYNFATHYNLLIEFKDNKVKFAPQIISIEKTLENRTDATKIYVSSSDSSNPNEVSCIWFLNKKTGKYILLDPDLKATADAWINSYIAGLVAKVNDNW